MITGINHLTLAVRDINISFVFYKDLLGFTPLVKWSKGAYFTIGDSGFWFCLNVNDKRVPNPCYTHYAFSVSQADFTSLANRIISSGTKVFKQNVSFGESLYFLDPDEHKLEIHASNIHERLAIKKNDPGSWEEVEWFL